jgi:Mlc titration factor MtfA (ptsG expression regulator)
LDGIFKTWIMIKFWSQKSILINWEDINDDYQSDGANAIYLFQKCYKK